jgi:hypothetical protein
MVPAERNIGWVTGSASRLAWKKAWSVTGFLLVPTHSIGVMKNRLDTTWNHGMKI